MAITNLLKAFNRKIILPLTVAGAALFAQKAYAQDSFDDPATKRGTPTEKAPASKDESSSRNLDKLLDGYLKIEGHSSPSEKGVDGSAAVRFNTGNWRPAVYLRSGKTLYDGGDGEDTDVFSNAALFELSTYLKKGKDLDIFFAPHIGFELDKFSESIDMTAYRGILGTQFGIASRESGSRLLVSLDAGFGKYDSELLSGFENDGNFSTWFAGLEGRQRLWSGGKISTSNESEFDLNQDFGYEFKHSFYASLEAFVRDDKLGDLQDAQGAGIRFSLPYVLNLREYKKDAKGNVYGEGILWKFTPFIEDKFYKTTSDLSLRETKSNELTLAIRAEAQFTRAVGVYGEAGYQWHTLKVDSPGQGIDSSEDKNGFEFTVGAYLRF